MHPLRSFVYSEDDEADSDVNGARAAEVHNPDARVLWPPAFKLMKYIRHYERRPKTVKRRYFDPTRRITASSAVY